MKDYTIVSNQIGIHDNLTGLVAKHLQSEYLKPISQEQRERFAWVADMITAWSGSVFLDSGCGRGKSTLTLAQQHPDTLVIGMDKSTDRLPRDDMGCSSLSDNTCFILSLIHI